VKKLFNKEMLKIVLISIIAVAVAKQISKKTNFLSDYLT